MSHFFNWAPTASKVSRVTGLPLECKECKSKENLGWAATGDGKKGCYFCLSCSIAKDIPRKSEKAPAKTEASHSNTVEEDQSEDSISNKCGITSEQFEEFLGYVKDVMHAYNIQLNAHKSNPVFAAAAQKKLESKQPAKSTEEQKKEAPRPKTDLDAIFDDGAEIPF